MAAVATKWVMCGKSLAKCLKGVSAPGGGSSHHPARGGITSCPSPTISGNPLWRNTHQLKRKRAAAGNPAEPGVFGQHFFSLPALGVITKGSAGLSLQGRETHGRLSTCPPGCAGVFTFHSATPSTCCASDLKASCFGKEVLGK